MIELSLKTDFSRMERALQLVAREQMPFAIARSLNDVTRMASTAINGRMGETFDRPTAFTTRAVVAPRQLAASKDHLASTVTVRPVQAKYLLHEEIGGARSPTENTRRPGAAIVLPGRGLLLDPFGNIPSGTLRRLKLEAKPTRQRRLRQAAAKAAAAAKAVGATVNAWSAPQADTVAFLPAGAPGNRAHIGGYFRRLAGHRLTRLTAFEATAHYQPRFHYRDQVARVAVANWADALRRRLAEAIATAR